MPKKILLADDSITIQKVVELTFSDGDYEVTAVNNGAKAVQKLAEMRPDIILSDIIMPEKNGYEVCEFVKSHPEYRNIPIILLTGTFEPFDPDRAEKAGCDAVVTKPFESQSLIHKVEELIAQASSSGAAAAEPPAADDTWATGPSEQSAWAETPQTPPVEAPTEQWGEPPPSSPFAQAGSDAQDLFGSSEPPPPTVEVPYSAPPAAAPFLREEEPAAAAPAASPWDEQPAYSGETRTFPRMSFDDLEKMAAAPEPPAEPQADLESPFGAPPPAEEFSGETRAFTKMSFDDLQKMATGEPPPPPPAPVDVEPPAPEPPPIVEPPQTEASPWEEEQPAAAAAPTWDEPAAPEPPAWEQPAPPPPSPWDEQPAFSGETRAFTKMSFDDLQSMAATPAPAAEEPSWQEPAPTPDEPAFAPPAFTEEAPAAAAAPEPESLPWSAEPAEPAWQEEPELPSTDTPAAPMPFEAEVPEPEQFFAGDRAEAMAEEAVPEAEAAWGAPAEPAPVAEPVQASAPASFDLTDEMVDRIARRVVELMSDQVIRSIAWEVIPDSAEIAIKERIRQLEAEEA